MGTPEPPRPAGAFGRGRARWRRKCAYCRERGCPGTCPQYQAVREAELRWDEARAAARRAASVPPQVIDPAGAERPRPVRPATPPPG